ncbi:MAG TPA: hypothetical protein VFQ53_05575 [Kofleriaceae bacterium]|nr:hypothetical protein [Kofleriaceae bacterium]
MTRWIFGVSWLVACGGGQSPPQADGGNPPDAIVFPDAAPCPTTATANVVVEQQTLAFAGLGNVDAGGESSCGGPPEAVRIVLSADASRDPMTSVFFDLPLPVASGPQAVTAFRSGQVSFTATFEASDVVVEGGGPRVLSIRGSLTGQLAGSLDAAECPELTTSCL